MKKKLGNPDLICFPLRASHHFGGVADNSIDQIKLYCLRSCLDFFFFFIPSLCITFSVSDFSLFTMLYIGTYTCNRGRTRERTIKYKTINTKIEIKKRKNKTRKLCHWQAWMKLGKVNIFSFMKAYVEMFIHSRI